MAYREEKVQEVGRRLLKMLDSRMFWGICSLIKKRMQTLRPINSFLFISCTDVSCRCKCAICWCGLWPAVSAMLWMRRTNSHGLQKPVEKRDSMAALWVRERAPTPAWTGFYYFLGALHQRRFSFVMLRSALGDHFLQVTKKRMLQMQENDKSDWSGYTPSWNGLAQTWGSYFKDTH